MTIDDINRLRELAKGVSAIEWYGLLVKIDNIEHVSEPSRDYVTALPPNVMLDVLELAERGLKPCNHIWDGTRCSRCGLVYGL